MQEHVKHGQGWVRRTRRNGNGMVWEEKSDNGQHDLKGSNEHAEMVTGMKMERGE